MSVESYHQIEGRTSTLSPMDIEAGLRFLAEFFRRYDPTRQVDAYTIREIRQAAMERAEATATIRAVMRTHGDSYIAGRG